MVENFNNFLDTRPTDLTSYMIDEIIQIYGIPAYYIKKNLTNLSKFFGEDDLTKFDDAYSMYLLPEDPERYGGSGDSFGNFGWEIGDSMQMCVEIGRFQDETGLDEPIEDDLVFIPILSRWFQVTYQTDEKGSTPFFWNGKVGAFMFDLLSYQFSHERIDTGIPAIDDNLPDSFNQVDTDNDNVETEVKENGLLDEFDSLIKGE